MWAQAGFWGFVAAAGCFLKVPERLIAAIMAFGSGVDTKIPEAFEVAHDFAGLITVAGFLAALALSRLGQA
jgi:ZIP family zinc transporter